MKTIRALGATSAIAISTCLGGCAWLLSGGQASQPQVKTAPIEITNMSGMTVCSVKIWRDKRQGWDAQPDQNLLEHAVSTPMGIEVKVFPIQPGDSQYFHVEAPDTYHAKVTPCGGSEKSADDFLVDKGGYKWILN